MTCLAILELNQLPLLVPGREVAPPILLRLRLLFLLTPVTGQMLNNQERISHPLHLLLDTSRPAIRRVLLTPVLRLQVMVRAPNQERISRPRPHLLPLVTGHPAIPRLLPILVRLHQPLPQHNEPNGRGVLPYSVRVLCGGGGWWC